MTRLAFSRVPSTQHLVCCHCYHKLVVIYHTWTTCNNLAQSRKATQHKVLRHILNRILIKKGEKYGSQNKKTHTHTKKKWFQANIFQYPRKWTLIRKPSSGSCTYTSCALSGHLTFPKGSLFCWNCCCCWGHMAVPCMPPPGCTCCCSRQYIIVYVTPP